MDAAGTRQQLVKTMINGVVKKTSLIVLIASLIAAIYTLSATQDRQWWPLSAGILFGGVLGLLNFRWLAVAVERVYLRQGATPVGSNFAAVVISVLKLTLIFIILFIVIKWRLVHIFGLVGGLSLCFLAILWEGVTLMKQTHIIDK